MKKTLANVLLLISILVAGFSLGILFKKTNRGKEGEGQTQVCFTDKKKPSPVIESKNMVFVVYGYNCASWVDTNLKSILDQNYLNYRVIYIEDGSDDNTYECVKKFIEKNNCAKNFEVIHHTASQGRVSSYYLTIHNSCKDEEIVIWLEGTDWLAGPNVLATINEVYNDPSIWLTYSAYSVYPHYTRVVPSEYTDDVIQNGTFRFSKYKSNQLKTFYAGLFKKMALSDFFYQGTFYSLRCGKPFMFKMLEMARFHFTIINQVLVINNAEYSYPKPKNPKEIKELDRYIRSLPISKPLSIAPYLKQTYGDSYVDFVIFSSDRAMQLHAVLESLEKYIKGNYHLSVIYNTSNEKHEEGYKKVQASFPNVQFLKESAKDDLKSILLNRIFSNPSSNYVSFGVDGTLMKDYVNLSEITEILEKTHSHAFYLSLGGFPGSDKEVKLTTIQKQVLAWQFNYSKNVWAQPNNLSMAIYRKKDILQELAKLKFNTPNHLRKLWENKTASMENLIGLCYKDSKVIHLYPYLDSKALLPDVALDHYLNGDRIALNSFYQMKNQDSHVDFEIKLETNEAIR